MPDAHRKLSRIDHWLAQLDHARLTLSDHLPHHRPVPTPKPSSLQHESHYELRHAQNAQAEQREDTLPIDQPRQGEITDSGEIAALLRIDHTGEVCAQALYIGQASQARTEAIQTHLLDSAKEEEAHLLWCATRLNELGSRPSRINPVWYTLSFLLGAAIAKLGDRISLGFIHATENQVKRHLSEHIELIGSHDPHTLAILTEMHKEEDQHASAALAQGGTKFPQWVQSLMWTTSRVMAFVSRRY